VKEVSLCLSALEELEGFGEKDVLLLDRE